MASTNYHHSSQASRFTEHEALCLLREEDRKHQEKIVKAGTAFREMEADVAFYEDELDAVLENERDELGTISTYDTPAHKLKVYGKAHLTSLKDTVQYFWGTGLGILMFVIGGIVIPAIDAAMFHNLFSNDFENQFGELTSTQSWLVALFSLQALGTFLAAKFFVTTPERKAKLAVVVFALGILFAVGASLEHANDKMLEHQLASSEPVISWDSSQSAQTASEIGWLATISTFLLSLGFIALPLLGALLLSLGWDTFIQSRTGLKKAKLFRRSYKSWKQAIKTRDRAEADLIYLVQNHETIVRGPMDERIKAVLRSQRGQVGAVRSLSQSVLYGIIGLPSPDDPTARIKNVDGVSEHAEKQIAEYGSDYSDRMIEKWKKQKPPA